MITGGAVPPGPEQRPEPTAERVALWRAMHVQVDPPPHVLDDEIGLRLVAPGDDWRARPDMDPVATRGLRSAVVARARFVEDLVAAQFDRGVLQYVILGAGLDTYAQRRPGHTPRLEVFEVDQPGPQTWKRRRLADLGLGAPDWLRFVAVNFEDGRSWWQQLAAAGFDGGRPTVVASTGVTMYLTREATAATMEQLAGLASGSTVAMSFLLPPDLLAGADRAGLEASRNGARAAGTPFVSFFTPQDMLSLARHAGFSTVRHIPGSSIADRYFTGRPDGLRPSAGEDFLVATT